MIAEYLIKQKDETAFGAIAVVTGVKCQPMIGIFRDNAVGYCLAGEKQELDDFDNRLSKRRVEIIISERKCLKSFEELFACKEKSCFRWDPTVKNGFSFGMIANKFLARAIEAAEKSDNMLMLPENIDTALVELSIVPAFYLPSLANVDIEEALINAENFWKEFDKLTKAS